MGGCGTTVSVLIALLLFFRKERTGKLAGLASFTVVFNLNGNVSTKGDGHGIGLSRIRELVNLYHGQIRVESEPKSGTAFFLSFQTPEEERAEEEPSPNE